MFMNANKPKFSEKILKELEVLVKNDVPAKINRGITLDEYYDLRRAINFTVMQAVFGMEIKYKDKTGKITTKFNHKPAKIEVLNAIADIIDTYIANIERPFLDAAKNVVDDDMYIPVISDNHQLSPLEKVNKKSINSYMFGSNGLSDLMINGKDVYAMATEATKIRKTKNRNTVLIIGGITLLLAGGVVTILALSGSKGKRSDEDEDVPDTTLDKDIDLSLDTDVDLNISDDVPSVDFD